MFPSLIWQQIWHGGWCVLADNQRHVARNAEQSSAFVDLFGSDHAALAIDVLNLQLWGQNTVVCGPSQ